ncbi:uncharacterized protein SPAPADRAFT_58489 [Spathaspora passalidarum NRRL Y-27907]|uniref:SB domain-containing protein n=1 Tax=Spathaspora passalidarum (strain NRRL Y-27907 / 11-Y1) TaxID=619300 RepID=G3AGD6_SPAPN|nr:uncharacterized protein SPAPADRAFT_58489 [Spathaspora passalidarum NRRL Y-27907]EGW35275.1 hypothetical protein SPAPADRAFT_58489 [Spathaspora passalidarum NRRL Y-27907]
MVDPPVSSSPPMVHASSSSDAVPQLPPKPAKVPLHQPPVPNTTQVQSPQLTGPPSVGIPQSANPQYTGPRNEVNTMGPQTTGPPLPAKPPKLQSPTTQTINPIPLKYQAPLPLPGEQPQSQPQPPVQPEYQHFNQASPPPPFSATHFNYPKETSASPIQPIPYGPQKAAPSPQQLPPQQHNIQPGNRYTQQRVEHPQERHPVHVQHQPNLPIAKQPVVDLMDAVASSSKGSTSTQSDAQRRQMLEQLSIKINSYLTDPTNGSVNSDVPMVNEHANKAEALYNQLNHHYQQALGNTRNLDDHLAYLTTQLTHVSNLNQELMKLEELNSASKDKVYTGTNTALTLDDLIIPDSPLVKQLYETVSEIKSIKDTINLISGNFHNQPELINDSRLDVCIKTVRNLGRELFWLELTKDEIAHSIMNLPRQ